MNVTHVYAVYFSPTGNTRHMVCSFAKEVANELDCPYTPISLDLPSEREAIHRFSQTDLVIVGGPTYAGKLPNKLLSTYQEKLQGNGALAVGLVTFGNRSFDNSLAELCATLETNGFHTLSAGAFVCTHAFSQHLAPNRPNENDMSQLMELAHDTAQKLCHLSALPPAIQVAGVADAPYYIPKGIDNQPTKFLKAKPQTNQERCVQCGLCAKNCPMGSISLENPADVTGVCIKCQRCIHNCPNQAKYFDDPAFLSHVQMLEKNYTRHADNALYR